MKRKIMLVLIVCAVIVLGYLSYYLSYISLLAGFGLAKFGSGKQEGKGGRIKSIIISWHAHQLHLHHWVMASITSTICVLKGFYIIGPELFYGFLGGLIIQGIYCYGDWYRIIKVRAQVEAEPLHVANQD